MENEPHLPETASFNEKSDICQQLFDRYGKSSAAQHRHLCATAAAARSIIQSESLPLTPYSYFAVTVSTLADSSDLDPDALAALSSLLSIILPLVPEKAIIPPKATEALEMLAEVLGKLPQDDAVVGSSSVRALVKCLGILLGFCDLDDWESVKLGLRTLLTFSIDRRPKVRKCAHECLLTVMKSVQTSSVIKRASKSIHSFIEGHLSLAIEMTSLEAADGFKHDSLSKHEHQEVYHTLNLVKTLAPYVSVKVCQKILIHLLKLMSSHNSDLTRHVFENIGVILDSPKVKLVAPDAESILKFLVSYMSSSKNPTDRKLVAATLTEKVMKKLHDCEVNGCSRHLLLIIGPITDFLKYEATALPASLILKRLIQLHVDKEIIPSPKKQTVDCNNTNSPEFAAMESICAVFHNILRSSDGIPNEYILQIVSVLFLKLGERSYHFMKNILLQLADWMNISCHANVTSVSKHLQECIGSATIAMGPDKLLALLPISFDAKDNSCTNTWLIPILRKYAVYSSLEFFMKHIVPLAESFQQASFKVKKSVIRRELQAYAHDCWGLLPTFCHSPTDICQNFNALSKILIPYVKKGSFMLEIIATSLKNLVNHSKNLIAKSDIFESIGVLVNDDFAMDLQKKSSYSRKTAQKNIKAISSCSEGLLQALTNVSTESYPETHEYLKEAIECLASISDSETTQTIVISLLEKNGLANGSHAYEKHLDESEGNKPNKKEDYATSVPEDAKRLMVLELASCITGGANEDLICIFFNITKRCLEANDEIFQAEAYNSLSRMLERHHWFRCSHFAQSLELLTAFKTPRDIKSITSRFSCFKTLLIHAIKENLEKDNPQAFLILNEIILALKESNNEGRKAAYDVLTGICSYMQNSLSEMSPESHINFITMVMGYLTGPPQIKSGAISALSVLIYNYSDICHLVPDLVPSVLALLKSKGLEVIKAVLGFVKVLVSCLQTKSLNFFLPDIVNGVLPWTATSRHHFRSKVSVVMEILARKCGTDTVKSIAPEKYADFLQSITENRYRKKSVKETEASTSLKGGGCVDSGIGQSSKKRTWQRRQKDVTGNHHNEDEASFGPKKRKTIAADHSTRRKWAYTGGSTPTQAAKRGRGKSSPGKPGKSSSVNKKNPSKQKVGANRAGHKMFHKKHGTK